MKALTVLIKPASGLCNMQCKYCFYKDEAEHRSTANYGIMTVETAEKLVEKAFECAENSVTFAFQGGEPTLAGISFFEKFLEFECNYNVKKIAVNHAIQTNGYIIDEGWAQFFAKNNFLVGLSMDGPCTVHDSMRLDRQGNPTHAIVMKASEILDKYHVEYNILCVVNNLVAKRADKVYNWFVKNNFKYLQFIPCLDGLDGEKKDFSLSVANYADFLKKVFQNYYIDYFRDNYISVRTFDNYVGMLLGRPPESCGMSGFCTTYFTVEADGSVYPCDFYVLDPWYLGNINQASFDELLKSSVLQNFVAASKYVDEKCKTCEWYGLCRGGCRRNREPFAEEKPALNIYCEAYKEFFQEMYPRLKEIAQDVYRRNYRK